MKTAPTPENEDERLAAVHRMAILDTKPEVRFDAITKEAVKKLKVPISTITILDKNREWFKSCQGLAEKEGERAISFCGHALLAKDLFIIRDTLEDSRFADNPMVISKPFIRFYCGMALADDKTGLPIGVFCVKDIKPRDFNASELGVFMELADTAERELNKV